jgi:hypothetical protein
MAFPIEVKLFDQHGEYDDAAAERSHNAVIELFRQSPEFEALPDSVNAVFLLLVYAGRHFGESVTTISASDLNEVLFDLIPRKVLLDREDAPVVIAELRAFWTWLDREFALPNAPACRAVLDDDAADELAAALVNRSNFGMAKQLMVLGQESGFDISSDSGLQAFLQHYNREIGQVGAASGDIGGLPPPRQSRDERRKKHKKQRAAKRRNRR